MTFCCFVGIADGIFRVLVTTLFGVVVLKSLLQTNRDSHWWRVDIFCAAGVSIFYFCFGSASHTSSFAPTAAPNDDLATASDSRPDIITVTGRLPNEGIGRPSGGAGIGQKV